MATVKTQQRDHIGPYLLGPNDTEENGIYIGDARDLLADLPTKSVDAFVMDPPFFLPAMHYQSRVRWQRKWADVSILRHWWAMMCDQMKPALKPMGYFLAFCDADSYPAFYPAMYDRWDRLSSLVWDKLDPGLGRNWRHQHEFILVACNAAAYLPDDGKLRTDVLRYKATPPSERQHPVQKPVVLLRDLIEAATPPSGIVCDPFCGSGTTAAAACIAHRRYLCFEADAEYVDIARHMMQNAKLPLFIPQPEQIELAL